jgi:hypothetical protein
VTYKYEYNAQFAKEAMACQSLDNDEILNVRWATEDPNPTSKVAEKRRLEELGREAITARMDPRIVDAVRAVRALEEGIVLDDNVFPEEDDDGPGAKRRRIEDESIPPAQEEAEVEEVRDTLGVHPAKVTGLLSADTLEGLKYFAEIRQRGQTTPALASAAPAKLLVGMGVADYGSDEED